ncbi:hypothetical protein CYY_003345 [Polysphondylium violaceum]|uniref:DUF4166 domain-containing protein n=1 Tax=Polysphondylium violaceum TaxID=133409 RepID=A0A8J4PZW1_9MYCE|nr:hypothetical protein CYY_003345 [Polysphondylium violaceum]
MSVYRNVFAIAMGNRYNGLPKVIQEFHNSHHQVWNGQTLVNGSSNILVSTMRFILGMPQPTGQNTIPISLVVTFNDKGEQTWKRKFAGKKFYSTLGNCQDNNNNNNDKSSLIYEKFGLLTQYFRLIHHVDPYERLSMEFVYCCILGIKLPKFLEPTIVSNTSINPNTGLYQFNVKVDLPIVGNLISYQGYLNKPKYD